MNATSMRSKTAKGNKRVRAATPGAAQTYVLQTDLGMMRVETNERDEIISLGLAPEARRTTAALSATVRAVGTQLDEYMRGERTVFELPLAAQGTEFQQQVWAALRAVPFGKTKTYAQIAKAIGRPKASRAVGAACGANPIGIVVPCHRVIGSGGGLTGYYWGTAMKAKLLAIEGIDVDAPLFAGGRKKST